ncbi:MAG: polysaccharide biosynthesis/export family protein [Caulobacteraceae bacterium]
MRFTSDAPLVALAREGRVDLIGPGDVLQINVFEVGTMLFSSGATNISGSAPTDLSAEAAPTPTARSETIPGVVVDRDGAISLPYVGELAVAGHTAGEVARMVEHGLAGKSQAPQAVVSISGNVANTILVSGAVSRPGRQPLTLQRERLLDAIATAGGTGAADGPQSTLVRFVRDGHSAQVYLEAIRPGSPSDLVLLPGDRVDLVRQPRTFSVFGAAGKVSQVEFDSSQVSLSEAIARSGGPDDARADATAVFVFRYQPAPDGAPGDTPAIYRLNLMRPSSYFLAQRFMMRDKDVIYIANAGINQTRKLVEVVDLLFSPALSTSAAVRQ